MNPKQRDPHNAQLALRPGPSVELDLRSPRANLLPAFLQRFDRKQTRRAYRSDLVQFFGTEMITYDLVGQASFLHMNQYISELEASGMKATTIKRKIAAIRGFFDWLEALELIASNPTKKELLRRIRNVRRKDQAIVFLTAKQASQLLDATDQAGAAAIRDRALLSTMLHCVLRRSEVAAMDAEHVRPLGHYWVVDLHETKGGEDQYVKIPAHVVEEIERVREHYGITSGPLWRSLSNNSRGKRLSPTAIYEIARRTAERAALPAIGAHTLRHTGCTLAIEAGASLQQVQSHARHKNIETTMVYIHQRDRLRDSAADFIHIKK
jgi:site-specific recombinase XerD